MSKGRNDSLEHEINRYLDGDISDEEFERFLRDYPRDIDVNQVRALKSRVERIEELYRQIEEPVVPDGYWESFADRVAQRLPEAKPTKPAERLLSYFLPWRWPVAAYSYAGAVASLILIFFIGKTVQESGKDIYYPMPVESVYEKSMVGRSDSSAIAEKTAVEMSQLEGSVGVESGFDAPAKAAEVVQDGYVETKGAPAAREKLVDMAVTEEKSAITRGEMDVAYDAEGDAVKGKGPREQLRPATEQPVEIVVDAPILTQHPTLAEPVFEVDELTKPSIGDDRGGPLPEDEAVVVDMDKGKSDKGDIVARLSMAADNVARGRRGEDSIWMQNDLNISALMLEYERHGLILDDSSYSSDSFLKHVKMLSIVARAGRDSTQIIDAIDAIDTLIKYNNSVDKELWLQRRSSLESMIVFPSKP